MSLKRFVIALTAQKNLKFLNTFAEKKFQRLNVILFWLPSSNVGIICKYFWRSSFFFLHMATLNGRLSLFSVKLCSKAYMIGYDDDISIIQYTWIHQMHVVIHRRVARIWKRGGLFWKSENCAKDLDPKFHCSWISFTRFVRKLRRNFSESSEIQRYFPPKIRWSPKKRSSPKLRLIFRPKSEIQTFFPPKIRWSPKKKTKNKKKKRKGLHQNWDWFFGRNRKSKRFRGGCFPMGRGLFSIFHKKSGSKPPKRCDFAYFTSQWGGSSPPAPPPPLATLLVIHASACNIVGETNAKVLNAWQISNDTKNSTKATS